MQEQAELGGVVEHPLGRADRALALVERLVERDSDLGGELVDQLAHDQARVHRGLTGDGDAHEHRVGRGDGALGGREGSLLVVRGDERGLRAEGPELEEPGDVGDTLRHRLVRVGAAPEHGGLAEARTRALGLEDGRADQGVPPGRDWDAHGVVARGRSG